MSRYFSASCLLFLVAFGTCSTAQAELFEVIDPWTPYLSGTLQGAFMDADSGGFNTEGPHMNFGGDRSDVAALGGALGLSRRMGVFRARGEVEGMWYAPQDIVTDSYPGPPGPATFFYNTRVDDCWSVMGNLWLDLYAFDRLACYVGGGLGGAGASLYTDDTVVSGSGSGTDFCWQFGTGVIYTLTQNIELDLGYRFVDLGVTDINLTYFGSSAGNYRVHRDSHNLAATVRINLY